jgi:hypothetical protein
MKVESIEQTRETVGASTAHSIEVTGLGIIAALLVACAGLVSDGSLPLNQYLVFAAFLLVSSGGLAWRIFKSPPARAAKSAGPREK